MLIPFPGRIKDGQYVFSDEPYQLECNDKDGPNAIHGFVRSLLWIVTEQTESSVRFTVDLSPQPGYPFSLSAEIAYSLGDDGLECGYRVCNTGSQAAPLAVGFHPYFSIGDGLIDSLLLELPFTGALEFIDLIPTGRVLPIQDTEFDFRIPRIIGSTRFNTCFVNPVRGEDGRTTIKLSHTNGNRITVWTDRSMSYAVLYSGDPLPESHRRRSLAIEPMTSASDGFNHPEWGLLSRAPGEAAAGAWGVQAQA